VDNGFVLQRRRFRESSLIVEFLTAERGRLPAVARGAMRPRSSFAAVLQPLVPLALELRGRGEMMTLLRAEPSGPAYDVQGTRLFSVLYVNELVMRLTAVHDPLPGLFASYRSALAALADTAAEEPVLRRFECTLLELLGLGLHLEHEAESGRPLAAAGEYVYVADLGALPRGAGRAGCPVAGATLRALAGAAPFTPPTLREAKRLMRYVLDHHLEGRPLAARELFAAGNPRKS